jgi:hypothetical protein
MKMHYGQLAEAVVNWAIEESLRERIVAIDLETKVTGEHGFLSGETILSIAVAYRKSSGGIHTEVFTLEEETLDAEIEILQRLNNFMLDVQPMILLGYGLTSYDVPLLNLKLRDVSKREGKKGKKLIFWGILDCIGRSFILDMKHPIRFEIAKYSFTNPKILSLDEVVNHEMFHGLRLMRTKNLVPKVYGSVDKGERIHRLWKNNKRDFERYAKGDVHDVLLIFEHLFLGSAESEKGKNRDLFRNGNEGD